MGLVQDLLPVIDEARGLLDDYGLRPFRVWVRVRDSAGVRAGELGHVDTDTEITVAGGKAPGVREIKSQDVVSSGGTITQADFEIGPLTPDYGTGGTKAEVIDPPRRPGREVFYVIKGPGLPDEGVLCKRTDDDTWSPFGWLVRVRRIGRNAG